MSQQDLTPPQPLAQRTMSLGIRTAIAAGGTSVHAVARRMGISSSYLTSLAKGKKNPSQEMLHLLAETLGTSVSEIYRRGEVEIERLRERDHRAARERAGRESTLAAIVDAMVHLEPEELDRLVVEAQRRRRQLAEEEQEREEGPEWEKAST